MEALIDRRTVPDRRLYPTRLRAMLNPRGRRSGFRRSGEGENKYLDRLTPRVTTYCIAVIVLSMLDAMFTLLHLENGGGEANPIMLLAIVQGIPVFLVTKAVLTILGVVVLAVHQTFRFGYRCLCAVLLGYMLLTAYHLAIFAGAV